MAGLLQNASLLGDDIPWLCALREKGTDVFTRLGVPGAKVEDWKYTKPRLLNADDFVLPEASAQHSCSCGCKDHCDEGCGCRRNIPLDAYQIHFENGFWHPEHNHFPEGVTVLPLDEAIAGNEDCRRYLGKIADIEIAPFAALNTAYLENGVFINIARGIKLDKPLVIICHTCAGERNLFYNLRNLVVMESGSEAEIIEYFHYDGIEKSRYFVNVVNEIAVGKNAVLKHYKCQDDAYKAAHVSLSAVQVKAGGRYQNFCLQKGADMGRNEVRVKLQDKGAEARVDAAYKMSGWATLDTTTVIEHLSPETYSEQLVKGVVDGEAKGVFQGKIHIAPNAVCTEGRQLHKALLLSDTAEIDCKPELEIFADDVKCSHGAASGELDEEQLFYMRSRGIDEDEARRILVEAFLDDVLMKVDSDPVRNWLKTQI